MKITPTLLAAATRILTENGKVVTDGIGFAAFGSKHTKYGDVSIGVSAHERGGR